MRKEQHRRHRFWLTRNGEQDSRYNNAYTAYSLMLKTLMPDERPDDGCDHPLLSIGILGRWDDVSRSLQLQPQHCPAQQRNRLDYNCVPSMRQRLCNDTPVTFDCMTSDRRMNMAYCLNLLDPCYSANSLCQMLRPPDWDMSNPFFSIGLKHLNHNSCSSFWSNRCLINGYHTCTRIFGLLLHFTCVNGIVNLFVCAILCIRTVQY